MLDPSNWTAEQHTKAFLMLMGGLEVEHPFRTFNDRDRTSVPALTRKLSGRFEDQAATLQQLNENGAGVFAVINKGGHRDTDITSVTAVFADTDGAPLEPIVEALPPHCVVNTSPGKFHIYWRVVDFPLDQFKPAQIHIAKKFGCDPSVNNLARVMRLPGFMHLKADPFDVRIIHLDAKLKAYTHAEIVEAFDIDLGKPTGLPTPLGGDRNAKRPLIDTLRSNSYSLFDVEGMLRFIDPWERHVWRDVIFALVHEYGEDSRELAVRWSRGDLSASRGRA
jgi:hypothetical protein